MPNSLYVSRQRHGVHAMAPNINSNARNLQLQAYHSGRHVVYTEDKEKFQLIRYVNNVACPNCGIRI